MLSPHIQALVFIFGVIFAGLLYSGPFFRGSTGKGQWGASILVGVMNFVFLRLVCSNQAPWTLLVLLLLLSGLWRLAFYIVQRRLQVLVFHDAPLRTAEALLYLGVLVFYGVLVFTMVGYDELYNFHFASQVRRGKIPPSFYAFPDEPAAYHYGWSLFTGSLSRACSLPLPQASDYLTLIMLTGCIFLLLSALDAIGMQCGWRVIITSTVFCGGGLLWLPQVLSGAQPSPALGLASMFQSHPWTFGCAYMALAFYALINLPSQTLSGMIFLAVFLAAPLAALPVLNGTSLALIAVCLLTVTLRIVAVASPWPRKVFRLVVLLAITVALFLSWRLIGGVFQEGQSATPLAPRLAFLSFDFGSYMRYAAAYVFMAPAGFVAFIACAILAVRKRTSLLLQNPGLIMIGLCCLLLYPLPLIVNLQNISIWDSYCKFNYFGILGSWILLGVILSYATASVRAPGRAVVALSVICIVLYSEAAVTLLTFWRHPNASAYEKEVRRYHNLVAVAANDIALGERVLVVNGSLSDYYRITDQGRMQVNLYRFVRRYFPAFSIAAQETGIAVVNFELMNGASPNNAKGQLLSLLRAAHQGAVTPHDLASHRIRYLGVMADAIPSFLAHWREMGWIREFRANPTEGWVIWTLHEAIPALSHDLALPRGG